MFLRRDKGKDFNLNGPFAFLTHPDSYFEYWSDLKFTRDHYWVCFAGPRIKNYIEGELFPVNTDPPYFNIANPGQFLRHMQELIALVESGSQNDRAVLLLEKMLFSLHEHKKDNSNISVFYELSLNELIGKIRQNPEKFWNFETEAGHLGITLNHFNRLFRKLMNTSPRQYVIQCRLMKAAKLLSETRNSICEISRIIGIENEFYFSRLFKSKYRLAPADYRKEFRSS